MKKCNWLERLEHEIIVTSSCVHTFFSTRMSPYEVYDIMKKTVDVSCRGIRHLVYEGQSICNTGFRRLMGIGKKRFRRMRVAHQQGEPLCPYDARYIKRGKQPPSEARSKVHQFLTGLYTTVAESIPDGLNSRKRPRQGSQKFDGSMDRSRIKHLPPGSISDYWIQCTAALPDITVSRKMFCSVSCLDI